MKWRTFSVSFLSYLTLAMLGSQSADSAESKAIDVTVDASEPIGKIRPLQDLHSGPLNLMGFVDVSHFYKDLGVRNVRLADGAWAYGKRVLSLGCVFPDDEADPDKPESYDFALTDHYLQSVADLGINIIYTLGGTASAEHSSERYPRRDPPKSFEHWANIASHVVRHYNDGWANGSKVGIKYWEIWNEPDIPPWFWTGTAEEYYQLYDVTAKKLKATAPTIKVGGPALSEDLKFLEGFLSYCRAHQVPLDFVSWHNYSPSPHDAAKIGRSIRELMDRYGFDKAESVLDEWNYTPAESTPLAGPMGGWTGILDQPENWQAKTAYNDLIHGEFGAAYDATMLMDLQDASVDIANYYTGTTALLGMFTQSGGPTKAFYSFLAFRQLLDSPQRVAIRMIGKGDVTTLAGLAEDRTALRLLVSSTDREKRAMTFHLEKLPWSGISRYKIEAIDRVSNLSRVKAGKTRGGKSPISIETDGPSVLLLTITRDSGS